MGKDKDKEDKKEKEDKKDKKKDKKSKSAAPESSTGKSSTQQDWDDREHTENVHIHMGKIIDFINKFDSSTRYQLALIDERLSRLESKMDYIEAALKS